MIAVDVEGCGCERASLLFLILSHLFMLTASLPSRKGRTYFLKRNLLELKRCVNRFLLFPDKSIHQNKTNKQKRQHMTGHWSKVQAKVIPLNFPKQQLILAKDVRFILHTHPSHCTASSAILMTPSGGRIEA